MTKGGVIMDVVNAEQAVIAEEAGAVSVMALEKVPADIRAEGGVAIMADPAKVLEIMDAVSIPVMAKVRIRPFCKRHKSWNILGWTWLMKVRHSLLQMSSIMLIRRDLQYLCLWCKGSW